MSEEKREMRLWWAVADNTVRLVSGYSCSPCNLRMWWCPEMGHTLTEGIHLFETEKEALEHGVKDAAKQIVEIACMSEKLADRLAKIQ